MTLGYADGRPEEGGGDRHGQLPAGQPRPRRSGRRDGRVVVRDTRRHRWVGNMVARLEHTGRTVDP
ncbi:hypothetical protein [Carbonactinospora thermoautotrophica]|uniref:hypothetical protein n=1 Tax=Carbonactinospora thermoautotrophica TaxID=1469144 RepID=UPI0018E2E1A8|nr:hypothetical protein [Carbonactinospora thermoautotrophica]